MEFTCFVIKLCKKQTWCKLERPKAKSFKTNSYSSVR